MINRDQGTGIVERVLYGALMFVAMKFVGKGYITADDAAWIAAGGVTLAGGAYAWWHNRPVSVLNRAGSVVPESSRLVIETPQHASPIERSEARALAAAASDKVVAKTAV